MPHQSGQNGSGMEGESPDSTVPIVCVESDREQGICSLRLTIGDRCVIGTLHKGGIVEIHRAMEMSARRDGHDPRASRILKRREQLLHQSKMAQMIYRELTFIAVGVAKQGRDHNPRAVDQDVERFA